tara:strand:- start:904 stop:2523 length:1620 start_codon:yes stop_codon:yes gene_type:complete
MAAVREEIKLTNDIFQKTVDTGVKQQYKIFFTPSTGGAEVLPVDGEGQVLPNAKPIYKNGSWVENQITLTEESQKSLHTQIQEGVGNYTKASGLVTPQWAEKQVSGETPTSFPNNPNSVQKGVAGGEGDPDLWIEPEGFGDNVGNIASILKEPLSLIYGNDRFTGAGIQGGDFDFAGDNQPAFMTPLKYPIDLSDAQDQLVVQCFSYQPPYADAVKDQKFGDLGRGARRTTPLRKKIGKGIYLPMPQDVNDTNSVSWAEDNMNNMAIGAFQHVSKHALAYGGGKLLGNILSGLGMNWAKDLADKGSRFASQAALLTSVGQTRAGRMDIGTGILSQLAGDMGYEVSPEQILSRTGGVISNSNTELMFSGVKLRSFRFSYRMTGRSPEEAARINTIVRALKQWGSPRKVTRIEGGQGDVGNAGAPSYFLGTPHVFQLSYRTAAGKNILGVNKFKPCALTDFAVNYAPEREWMAYEGGQPVSIQIDMSFTELEPIYNTDYNERISNRAFSNRGSTEQTSGFQDLFPLSVSNSANPFGIDVGY